MFQSNVNVNIYDIMLKHMFLPWIKYQVLFWITNSHMKFYMTKCLNVLISRPLAHCMFLHYF